MPRKNSGDKAAEAIPSPPTLSVPPPTPAYHSEAAETYAANLLSMLSLSNGASANDIDSDSAMDLIRQIPSGVYLNTKRDSGYYNRTLLHLACKRGFTQMVEALLTKEGFDVHAVDSQGKGALHIAAERGNLNIAQLLLRIDGIDINLEDETGSTPLHWAAVSTDGDTSSDLGLALVEKGANVNCVSKDHSMTPLHYSIANKGSCREELALRLVSLMTVEALNIENQDGMSALHLACRHCPSVALKLAEMEGLEVSGVDKEKLRTPLHYACNSTKGTAVAHLLIKKMTSETLNLKDHRSMTALHWATYNRLEDVALRLIAVDGINLTEQDEDARTPLHWACKNAMHQVCLALIAVDGINLTEQDEDARTPLHWACKNEMHQVCLALIAKMAPSPSSFSLRDKRKQTALHIVCIDSYDYAEMKEEEVVGETDEEEAETDEEEGETDEEEGETDEEEDEEERRQADHVEDASDGSVEVFHRLLEVISGDDIDAQDEDGDTALLIVCSRPTPKGDDEVDVSEEMYKSLIAKGARIDVENDNKVTPLIAAVTSGKASVATDLISRMAEQELTASFNTRTEREDFMYYTALHFACIAFVQLPEIAFKLLAVNGVDVNLQCGDGNTPLHVLCKVREPENFPLFLALVEKGAQIESLNKKMKPPIAYAVSSKKNKIARHLMDRMTVEGLNACGLLHVACFAQNYEMALRLLEYRRLNSHGDLATLGGRSDSDHVYSIHGGYGGDTGRSPSELYYCGKLKNQCRCGRCSGVCGPTNGCPCDACKELITSSTSRFHGIDVNYQDEDGDSPLHILCMSRRSNTQLCLALMVRGADLSCVNKANRTPLVCLLLNSEQSKSDGKDELALAFITKMSADSLNIPDKRRYRALHHACKVSNPQVIMKLLEKDGVEHDVVNEKGSTPLHQLAYYSSGCVTVFQALVAKGVKINRLDQDNCTALTYACMGETEDIATLLLPLMTPEAVNVSDKKGYTALMYACRGDSESLALSLIQCAAVNSSSLELFDDDGLTPLLYSIKEKQCDIAVAIIEKSVRVNVDLNMRCTSRGSLGGKSALHMAASLGLTEVVRSLIVHGASLNLVDPRGRTALHLVTHCTHGDSAASEIEIARLLIEAGVDTTIPDQKQNTALSLAKDEGNDVMVNLLLSSTLARGA